MNATKDIIEHTIQAVKDAEICEKPFPHIVIQNIFEENLYERLLDIGSQDALFSTDSHNTTYDILRYPLLPDHISSSHRDILELLAYRLLPVFYKELTIKFSDHITAWSEELKSYGVNYFDSSRINSEIIIQHDNKKFSHYLESTLEFIRRKQDFDAPPHHHPIMELFIGIFCLQPDNALVEYGTDMYFYPDRGDKRRCTDRFTYFQKDGLIPGGKSKFEINSAFIIMNKFAVHAFNPPEQRKNRNYIYSNLIVSDLS